jgi:hypothetical protein
MPGYFHPLWGAATNVRNRWSGAGMSIVVRGDDHFSLRRLSGLNARAPTSLTQTNRF